MANHASIRATFSLFILNNIRCLLRHSVHGTLNVARHMTGKDATSGQSIPYSTCFSSPGRNTDLASTTLKFFTPTTFNFESTVSPMAHEPQGWYSPMYHSQIERSAFAWTSRSMSGAGRSRLLILGARGGVAAMRFASLNPVPRTATSAGWVR